jgi:GGDEF domain-containing protein
VVLLPRARGPEAEERAEPLRGQVAAIGFGEGGRVGTTVSIGIACLRADHTALAELLAEAGAALLEAKRTGKDRVVRSRPG